MALQTDPEARATRTVWTDDQIQTMLDSLEKIQGQFGQGANPKKTHFEDAAKAVNEALGGTGAKPKTASMVQTKWAQMKAIYKGLLAWDLKTGRVYDDEKYGCGVDASSKGEWSAHTAAHKTVKQFSNTPWPFFKTMARICSTSVKPQGEKVFAAHSTAPPASQPSQDSQDGAVEAEDSQTTIDSQANTEAADPDEGSVIYSDDDDILVSSQKIPATPALPKKRSATAADFTPPASQVKKGRVSAGAQALDRMSTTMDRFGTIVEKGMANILANGPAVLPAEPKTPTHHNHTAATEASPLRGQAAATHSAVEEYEHLGDYALVTKFICYLEENPTAVVTYNTLVKTGVAMMRQSYMKTCIAKYEAAEARKELGI
ncbi:hypothetical protein C8T65DRAFT_747192 [Cerioporus squamosus]|nr:hypothetical protein C8T65DRAFT_747192 [Cerioporus squamosus]